MANPGRLDLSNPTERQQAMELIKEWAGELGFQDVGVAGIDLTVQAQHLKEWLANGFHGEMGYMESHGAKRSQPDLLLPGTVSVITARMDYLTSIPNTDLGPETAAVSCYARGRDYHKLMRKRLAQLAKKVQVQLCAHNYRAFVDSAPTLERGLAEQSGMGWIGKNTMLINRRAGSWFFLGEIYTDLPLATPVTTAKNHCGSCRACLDSCPTGAFVEPYVLDARRCISYLTIEFKGSIPLELRPLMGNRIFGCDDCQQACPWNRFAKLTTEPDFLPRNGLDKAQLVSLFSWTETEFLTRTQGSPIRRTGYECWLRNIAIALGNAPSSIEVLEALRLRSNDPSVVVREHVEWALAQHQHTS